MNIAILMLNHGRGSGEVARQQARYLLDQGHKLYFVLPTGGSGLAEAIDVEVKLPGDTIPVHEYLPSAGDGQKAVSTMSYSEASAYLPAYEQALGSIIDDIDLVIGHHANLSAIATARVAGGQGKPYVLFLHGTGIEPRHHGHYDDRIWNLIQSAIEGAAGLIVTTEYVRDHLVRNLLDIPLERFLVLPCGIDLQEFHPRNTGGIHEKYNLPERYVICPGALTLAKGPQNVVAASEHYAEIAPTIFIGGGELRDQLETALGGRGRFLGFVPAADKAWLINAATLIAAAPEKKEHFGIIYAEGLAGGTPSVAYRGGGVSSIVTAETGILTERDPAELGRSIAGLLEDRRRINRMAGACRSRAEAHFGANMLGARLEKWLQAKAKA